MMTWGSHCPMCGGDCAWAHGDICEGKAAALRTEIATLKRALDEAEAREAVLREALEQVIPISVDCVCKECRSIRQKGWDALDSPSPRAEALMRVVEAAQAIKKNCFNWIIDEPEGERLEDALRAYQEGSK